MAEYLHYSVDCRLPVTIGQVGELVLTQRL